MTHKVSLETIALLEPFSSVSDARLRELVDFCRVEVVPMGGELASLIALRGNSVYLLSGEVELFFKAGGSLRVNAQSESARHPIGKRWPDIVSAAALRQCRVLHIDQGLLDRVMVVDQILQHASPSAAQAQQTGTGHSGISIGGERALRAAMFRADSLNEGPLSRLPTENISVLLQRIEAIAVRAGDVIIREGDEGDYYYVVDHGCAQVTRCVGDVDLPLALLNAGDVFGEEALISDARRSATVIMESDGVLLRLGRQDFLALLKKPLLHKMSYKEAIEAVAQGALWLDVGSPPEYRYDRLDGAINIPLNDLRGALGALDRERKYITYCQSGRRSAAAAFIMTQAGYDVRVLDGGLWSVPRPLQR